MMEFNKGYFPVIIVAALLGITILFLPDKKATKQMPPNDLLLEIMDEARFVEVEDVTDKIIKQDPGVQLIDVRNRDEYAKFSLPGAINIPLEKLLEKTENGYLKWEGYLNQDIKTNVFFSNGTVDANKAWTICRRMNFKNNYVMQGGLNEWFEKIIKVEPISNSASDKEIETYRLHKAMQQFFTGAKVSAPEIETSDVKLPVKKKKKKAASGGC